MILANKSGWLILVEALKKTRYTTLVREVDSKSEYKVSHKDDYKKLFNSTAEAMKFIEGTDHE